MFTSKRRNVVIPQSEHARLAGTIASVWGNHEIHGPDLPGDAFTLGVMSHDRGYGDLDSMGIGQVEEDVWLATQRRGITLRSPDPVVDTVALMHLRRLVSGHAADAAKEMLSLIDNGIEENLRRCESDLASFQKADTVTEACDMISFRFCFEEPIQFVQNVASGSGFRDIRVSVGAGGGIRLNPWPLSVPELHGCVIAYSGDGYPDHLKPVLLPFHVMPGEFHEPQ